MLPSGGGLLFGVEPVAGLVPLPPGTFVTLDEGGEVDVLSSEEGFSRSDWLEGVVGFTQAVCELLPIARGFSKTDEHHRLSLRGLAQERDRNSIAERLGGLIRRRRRLEGVGADEALPAVLRHFETEGGFRARVPTRSKRAQMDVPPTLEEICRASEIRLQRAALRPGWWSREGGPFFAHRADGAPVALIWRRSAFREMDADGRSERVDAARAARIEPGVHIPFAILPAKNDAFELFKRVLRDGRGDVWGFLLSVVVASVIAQVAPITTGFIFGTLMPAAMDAAIVRVSAAVALIGVVGFVVVVVGARTRLPAATISATAALTTGIVFPRP